MLRMSNLSFLKVLTYTIAAHTLFGIPIWIILDLCIWSLPLFAVLLRPIGLVVSVVSKELSRSTQKHCQSKVIKTLDFILT